MGLILLGVLIGLALGSGGRSTGGGGVIYNPPPVRRAVRPKPTPAPPPKSR